MQDYTIYKEVEEGFEYIVEMYNEGYENLQRIEKHLIEQGFIITEVKGLFIKCVKMLNN